VKLSCVVPQDLPRALLLDRTRLRQVLVNLVGNAVKFTDRGYIRVVVRWEAQQDSTSRVMLAIEVEDTGVGIPEDRLEEIFKPFAQADAARAKEKQGTGLGLAIVKRLVERMGGQVGVASIVGQGTTFHLRLPDVGVSARLPAGQQSEADEAADFDSLRASTVLVVDDNELNRQLMAGIFDSTHHRVHYGNDGREALDLTLKLRPDLVLLDIRMPGMDGREALDRIRATPGFDLVPIIAVTASSMADEEKKLRQKFSGYLRKPFTRRALLEEMAHFIPKLERPADAAPAPLEPPAPADSKAAFAALSVKLHALEAGEWPHVRDSVAVNESRRFARQLRTLAERARCTPLNAYAAALLRHAEAYDVAALETELGRFPQVIVEIERLSV
jgi:CheY-like chemotaxis protein/anti-sigma regulatory factor (Ser/Thr protein kinase)